MKSIHKLREWVNGLKGAWIDTKDNSLIFTTGDDVPPSMASVNLREHLNGILDDIVLEVEEHYVPLPVDADGVPIQVGDVMESGIESGPVEHLELFSEGGWVAVVECEPGHFTSRHPSVIRHHIPTVEDILREFSCVLMGKRSFDGDVADAIAEYSAKISDILHTA